MKRGVLAAFGAGSRALRSGRSWRQSAPRPAALRYSDARLAEKFSSSGAAKRTSMSHFRQIQLFHCYSLNLIKQTLLRHMAPCHILRNQTNTKID
jgi:hypothetical protein